MAAPRASRKAAAPPKAPGRKPGRLIRGLWWTALLVSLLLWLYFRSDPELLPNLAFLQYAPYPAFLGPVVVLALLMWPLGGRWRWLAWGPALVIAWPVMGLCTGISEDGDKHLRVMTYNVKSFLLPGVPGGHQKLTLEIAQTDPDIVFMQDAVTIFGMRDTHPELYKMMMGDRDVQGQGQYVIASRTPLRNCAPGEMPYLGQVHHFFHCETEVQGKRLTLITVHFNTPRDGLNATRFEGVKGLAAWKENLGQRLFQSALLAEFVRQSPKPCIVAGDLNAPEHSRVVQVLINQGMRDVYSASAWGWGYTHGHSLIRHMPFLRIDHILVSEDIAVQKAFVGGMEASQHRPVTADLYLQRQ
jgi:endonuclease/exonuclease/phosphatase family metal-dependent hydrolase